MTSPSKLSVKHLANLTPPSQDRTWLSCPHPRLPILATCCADKTVRIYSLINFTLLSTIEDGHSRSVRSCAWKPNLKGESVLATASFDSTVAIWRRWDEYGRSDGAGLGLTSETGAAEDGDGENEEDEDEEWTFAVVLDGPDSEIKSVSWSPGGSILATCSRDKSIWIWEDLEDGDNTFETVAVLQEHSGDVKWVSWHPEEECLASGSYDDTIRLWREDIDDWVQIACLRGHEGTVWCVEWEAPTSISDERNRALLPLPVDPENEDLPSSEREKWIENRSRSGPRLVSCSDDKTIRIWRKEPKAEQARPSSSQIPSIIRTTSIDETWCEEAQLPPAHDLSIYSVSWSKTTGLIASTGADGRIVVYRERFVSHSSSSKPAEEPGTEQTNGEEGGPSTTWEVIACIDATHGVYEVNHICWAQRKDPLRLHQLNLTGSKRDSVEEMLISTGDDGTVRAWEIQQQ